VTENRIKSEDKFNIVMKNFDICNNMGIEYQTAEDNEDPLHGITTFVGLQQYMYNKTFKTMDENK